MKSEFENGKRFEGRVALERCSPKWGNGGGGGPDSSEGLRPLATRRGQTTSMRNMRGIGVLLSGRFHVEGEGDDGALCGLFMTMQRERRGEGRWHVCRSRGIE
jgi:hypothetical protein